MIVASCPSASGVRGADKLTGTAGVPHRCSAHAALPQQQLLFLYKSSCTSDTTLWGLQRIAMEIAADEFAHVKFLRAALGSAAVPIPKLDMCVKLWASAC